MKVDDADDDYAADYEVGRIKFGQKVPNVLQPPASHKVSRPPPQIGLIDYIIPNWSYSQSSSKPEFCKIPKFSFQHEISSGPNAPQ